MSPLILIHTVCVSICIFVLPDINRDKRKVKKQLRSLKKNEMKDLFEELGLFDDTLRNKYGDEDTVYADDLISAWIHGKDDVLALDDYPGGPTWDNLKKALRELRHHGIANDIGKSCSNRYLFVVM